MELRKFLISSDGLNLIFDLTTEGTSYIHKIELWNYDKDVKHEVDMSSLPNSELYNDGLDTYTIVHNIDKSFPLISLGLEPTMICGIIYVIDISNNSFSETNIATSHMKQVYRYLVDKLVSLRNMVKVSRNVTISYRNDISIVQGIQYAHTEAMKIGDVESAKLFYSELMNIIRSVRP